MSGKRCSGDHGNEEPTKCFGCLGPKASFGKIHDDLFPGAKGSMNVHGRALAKEVREPLRVQEVLALGGDGMASRKVELA